MGDINMYGLNKTIQEKITNITLKNTAIKKNTKFMGV